MATGSADIAAPCQGERLGVAVTVAVVGGVAEGAGGRLHFLHPPPLLLHLSAALSSCLRACQYASICLMGPSEELTADTLVSLFPAAILLELPSVISHATDKQARPQHLGSPSVLSSSSLCVIAGDRRRGLGEGSSVVSSTLALRMWHDAAVTLDLIRLGDVGAADVEVFVV